MLNSTRKEGRGRNPSLRDRILKLLIDSKRGMTLKEVAEALDKDETTPYRPLQDLKLSGFVIVLPGEGSEPSYYEANLAMCKSLIV